MTFKLTEKDIAAIEGVIDTYVDGLSRDKIIVNGMDKIIVNGMPVHAAVVRGFISILRRLGIPIAPAGRTSALYVRQLEARVRELESREAAR